MAIKFIKSPTGAYNLGYNVGDETSLDADFEKKLITEGFALPVQSEPAEEKPKGKGK